MGVRRDALSRCRIGRRGVPLRRRVGRSGGVSVGGGNVGGGNVGGGNVGGGRRPGGPDGVRVADVVMTEVLAAGVLPVRAASAWLIRRRAANSRTAASTQTATHTQ
jgi:hypothetical protein